MDPFGVLVGVENAYVTYPLIYSAGPDGVYDINIGGDGSNGTYAYALVQEGVAGVGSCMVLDPYAKDNPLDNGTNRFQVGCPLSALSSSPRNQVGVSHYDNIHNHRMDSR